MSIADRASIIDKLTAAMPELLWNEPLAPEDAAVVEGLLERLSVEDHLVLVEEMLSKASLDGTARTARLRAAHQYVTQALDEVEMWVIESV